MPQSPFQFAQIATPDTEQIIQFVQKANRDIEDGFAGTSSRLVKLERQVEHLEKVLSIAEAWLVLIICICIFIGTWKIVEKRKARKADTLRET
jgi:hypothetical protein